MIPMAPDTWPAVLERYTAREGREGVADLLDVNVSTVGRWINLRQYPKPEQVGPLAGLLGISETALAGALHEARNQRTPAGRMEELEARVESLEEQVAALRKGRRGP